MGSATAATAAATAADGGRAGNRNWHGETFLPALADPVIPARPIDLLSSPNRVQIPIMAGYQDNEGAHFVPARDSLVPFFKTLLPSFDDADLSELQRLYPLESAPGEEPADGRKRRYAYPPPGARADDGGKIGEEWPRIEAAYARYAYICPVMLMGHWWGKTWRRRGGRMVDISGSGDVAPVYLYRFAALNAPLRTSNHGDEAAFVTRDPSVENVPGLRGIAVVMNEYWTRFISGERGDPNEVLAADGAVELPEWPRFESPFEVAGQEDEGKKGEQDEKGQLVVFGQGNDIRAGGKSEGVPAAVCRLDEWDKAQGKFWFKRVGKSEEIRVRIVR